MIHYPGVGSPAKVVAPQESTVVRPGEGEGVVGAVPLADES